MQSVELQEHRQGFVPPRLLCSLPAADVDSVYAFHEDRLTAQRDIIVIGASLGGVQALPQLVARLPADLRAAILVVMHMAPESANYLAERLDKAGPLQAAPAVDGELLAAGRIRVAVPDRHLMLEGNRIRLSRGPRENHARPSIDVLFRSAAAHFGPRVIGVVLTGKLDDGTAGAWAIKDRGGVVMIQSPEEAAYPSMPLSVAKHVQVDHTLTLAEMPEALRALAREELPGQENYPMPSEKLDIENRIALEGDAFKTGVRSLGQPSFFTCPECQGSMIAIAEGSNRRFRCHTGHAFTGDALAQQGLSRIERTLWATLAQLEEHQVILRELERRANDQSDSAAAAEYLAQAKETERLASRLRELTQDPALSHAQG